MIVHMIDDIKQDPVDADGAQDASIRWLLTKEMGAPNFAMREITVKPGGHSPLHTHDFEHEVYVISGKGVLAGEDSDRVLIPGTVALVSPGEKHQFRCTGTEELKFLCLVPNSSY